MKIREMRLLVRVAETGSMTLAAKQLHLTPAAVSAAVQRIEDALGVRLFERTTRSLHPTEEGLVVMEGCTEIVSRWQRVLDDAQGHRTELEGTMDLSAPADTTYQVLEHAIGVLCAAHPKLKVIVHTSDAVQQLHRDAIDMAIRYGPLQDSTLSARKLAEGPRVLVASPSYLEAWGVPQTPAALSAHRCLTLLLSNTPTRSWSLYDKDGDVHTITLDSPLCGDGHLARRWAVSGLGIAFKSLFDVIDDLEAGRLVQVLPEYDGGSIAIHALYPSRRFQPARLRVLTEIIATHFDERMARCIAWEAQQVARDV